MIATNNEVTRIIFSFYSYFVLLTREGKLYFLNLILQKCQNE